MVGKLLAGFGLLTTAQRFRTGPYPIKIQAGDQITLDDGTVETFTMDMVFDEVSAHQFVDKR